MSLEDSGRGTFNKNLAVQWANACLFKPIHTILRVNARLYASIIMFGKWNRSYVQPVAGEDSVSIGTRRCSSKGPKRLRPVVGLTHLCVQVMHKRKFLTPDIDVGQGTSCFRSVYVNQEKLSSSPCQITAILCIKTIPLQNIVSINASNIFASSYHASSREAVCWSLKCLYAVFCCCPVCHSSALKDVQWPSSFTVGEHSRHDNDAFYIFDFW